MLKFIYIIIFFNTEDAPFGIPGASTELENDLRVKLIIDINIGFMLEIDRYSCD